MPIKHAVYTTMLIVLIPKTYTSTAGLWLPSRHNNFTLLHLLKSLTYIDYATCWPALSVYTHDRPSLHKTCVGSGRIEEGGECW